MRVSNRIRDLAAHPYNDSAPIDPPAGGDPSGVNMSTVAVDLPGWTCYYAQNFDRDCAEGGAPAAYDGTYNAATALTDGKVGFYPSSYKDTRSTRKASGSSVLASATVDGQYGTYSPQVVSVSGGVMTSRIYTDTSNIHHVSAPVPRLGPTSTGDIWGAVDSGRIAVRARFRGNLNSYKIAWLWWPMSNNWPPDGEIDFPEADLYGTGTSHFARFFMHRQGATSGSDQAVGTSTVNPMDGAWHTYESVWNSLTRFEAIVDGVTVGAVQTSRVPSNSKMRFVIQTETTLDVSYPIDNSALGYVDIDWIVAWHV